MKRNATKSQERKGTSHSQRPASSGKKDRRNVSYTQGDSIIENIDDVLMDLSLKKPRNAYSYYISEMMEKEGLKSVAEASKLYSKKWPSISASQKKKYEEMAEKDKE